MTEAANSGDIPQRGIVESCPEGTAVGDVLPMKIHGSEGTTRGGGELHVDATGHFMRRFRNVLFRLGAESEATPEFDRVALEVVDDSWLHLTFKYEEYGYNGVRVTLTDTLMLGQEVRAQSTYWIGGVQGGLVEKVFQYHLTKGHHYALTVYYVGLAKRDEQGRPTCSLYDLTMSITRETQVILGTQCAAKAKDDAQTVVEGLPKKITDSDLDQDGTFTFEKLLKETEFVKNDGYKTMYAVSLELSNNYDLSASVEFAYDQAMYSMYLHEVSTSEDGDDRSTQANSCLQAPLAFKQNDDHYKSLRRELVADGIEAGASGDQKKRHILYFHNHEPGLLPAVNPGAGASRCLYLNVKITIKSTKYAAEELYSASESAAASLAPQISGCRPSESPTFLHDRPEQLTFDIIFNKQPFLKDGKDLRNDGGSPAQAVEVLREAIKLTADTVTIADGMRSKIQLSPARIYSNKKGYRADEYHVGVVFDVKEFSRSATEKLLHAQLVVHKDRLVDHEQTEFTMEGHLQKRGLPIYVFEETDVAQILKEEGDAVKQAVEGEAVGREAQSEVSADISTQQSDLEEKVAAGRASEKAEAVAAAVKCECAHGACAEGETTCSTCERGWTGAHCDTPSTEETLQNVNTDQKKDYTSDGLYQPQQSSEGRRTGPARGSAAREAGTDEVVPVHVRRPRHDGTHDSDDWATSPTQSTL